MGFLCTKDLAGLKKSTEKYISNFSQMDVVLTQTPQDKALSNTKLLYAHKGIWQYKQLISKQ